MDIQSFKEKIRKRYSSRFIDYITSDTERLLKRGEKIKKSLRSEDMVSAYQKELKKSFIEASGGIDYGIKCIDPQTVSVIDHKDYTIEKILFQSAPGNYVTSNLYKPKSGESRYPAIVFVCGHTIEAKAYAPYQAAMQELTHAGFAVLGMDPMGQGERLNYCGSKTDEGNIIWGVSEHTYNGAKAWLIGRPLQHYFIRDIQCAIDYLCGREDIDSDKIGITGNSGGGTQTSLMMLAQDERIKAFAPATYITEYMDNFKVWMAADDEQIYLGMLEKGFNYDDIIISVAPRPVNILAVFHDFFPCDGAIKTYQSAQRIYEVLGAKENLEITIDNAGHEYTTALARSAAKFFAKHLLGKKDYDSPIRFYDIRKPSKVQVTNSGQVSGDYSDAKFVSEEISAVAKQQIKNRQSASVKEDAVRFITEKTFFGRQYNTCELKPVGGFKFGRYSVKGYVFNSTDKLINLTNVYSAADSPVKKIKICFFDYGNDYIFGNEAAVGNPEFLDNLAAEGWAAAVVDLSNYGFLRPDQPNGYPYYNIYGYLYNMAHQMFFRGDSTAALRVFEILSAIRNIKNHFSQCDTEVYAEGRIEVLTAAALLIGEKIGYRFAEKFEGFYTLFEGLFYHGDIKSYIIPSLNKYCDYDDLKLWLSEKNNIGD